MLRAVSYVAPPVTSSSSQNALTTTQGGATGFVPMALFSNSATVVTSGTSASSWVPSGVGSIVLPANYLVPGKQILINARGIVATQATPGTVILALAFGSSNLWTSGPQTPTASLTQVFFFQALVNCLTAGSGGTCSLTAYLEYSTGINTAIDTIVNTASASTALNTTVSNSIALSTTNSVSGGTVFTVCNFTVQAVA